MPFKYELDELKSKVWDGLENFGILEFFNGSMSSSPNYTLWLGSYSVLISREMPSWKSWDFCPYLPCCPPDGTPPFPRHAGFGGEPPMNPLPIPSRIPGRAPVTPVSYWNSVPTPSSAVCRTRLPVPFILNMACIPSPRSCGHFYSALPGRKSLLAY